MDKSTKPTLPMAAIDDQESQQVPAGLPPIIDSHVQCFDMNGPEMDPIYNTCVQNNKPLVIHAGREPKSEQYPCDPYVLCRVDKLEAVLKAYPKLRLCVPHMGMDELEPYLRLIEQYDTLWLDTSVACAGFFPTIQEVPWQAVRLERIMYGSDYPNIPYAWDREIKQLVAANISEENRIKIFKDNAMQFFAITESDLQQDKPVSTNGAVL